MKRILVRIVLPILGALVLLFLILVMSGVLATGVVDPGRTPPPPGLAAPARTATVASRTVPTYYQAVGTVQPRHRATISAQISGQVIAVAVEEGERVTAGTLLARLQSEELQARLAQAESNLQASEAALVEAEKDYDRMRQLAADGATTDQQLDSARSRYQQAQAGMVTARQKVKEAQTFVAYTELTAPVDGLVSERLADPGDLAWPGKAIMVVYAPETMRLEAHVREGLIDRATAGTTVTVDLSALDLEVEAAIGEVVPSADPVSRSFLVKVPLPPTKGLYPGMFGELRLRLDDRQALFIPDAAVQRVGQLATVTVRTSDGNWQRRYVSLGHRRDGEVEALAGLRAGEVIGLPESGDTNDA